MNFNYEKQIQRIVNYIKSGETNPEEFAVGVEFEHFVVDKNSFNTISYYGANGVSTTLNELLNYFKSNNPIYDNDNLLGFECEDFAVTTEPGAQFEVSINAKKNLNELFEKYKNFINAVLPFFHKKNQTLVLMGYHPITKIDDIKILPKKRYDYMYEYFNRAGTMAHNMMKGTCAVQVVIDYKNEDDFVKKYFVGNVISPILYTIFDNSPIFEGDTYNDFNLRQKIWENTDKDRSGLFDIAFEKDLNYKKYAEKILNTPMIFTDRNHKLEEAYDKKIKDVFDPENDDDGFIYHALSIVFPDLRVKRYLEFRMMDAVKYPYNFSAAALIKGLFYDEDNLNKLYEKYKDITYEEIFEIGTKSRKDGLNTKFLNSTIRDEALSLIELAYKGLCEDEKKFLDPLYELIKNNKTLHEKFIEICNRENFKSAIEQLEEVKNVQ